jgi:ribosome recycling factor
MIDELLSDATERMQKSQEALQTELSKLRTGRAHPSLLSQIQVDYYGSATPLPQVASVAVESPRMLAVTPWEKNMIAPIEKAIMTSDLGLNPSSAGTVIRVPLPPLTEERRKSMTKLVREATEKARVSVRQARREFISDCKSLLKDKDITEDDLRGAEETIQKRTDQAIKELDQICQEKEADLMSV